MFMRYFYHQVSTFIVSAGTCVFVNGVVITVEIFSAEQHQIHFYIAIALSHSLATYR